MTKWSTVILLSLFVVCELYAQSVQIFFSSVIHPRRIERVFQMSNLTNMEFAAYQDFESLEDQVHINKPDVVLISDLLSAKFKDYRPVARLTYKNRDKIKYLLIQLDGKGDINGKKPNGVGICEIGDRNSTKEFLKKEFNIDNKLVKTVSKPDELIQMLTLGAVESVVMEDYNFESIRIRFATPMKIVKTSREITAPGFYVKKEYDSKVFLKSIKTIPKENLEMIGFDGIK